MNCKLIYLIAELSSTKHKIRLQTYFICYHFNNFIIFSGSAAQRVLRPPRSRNFVITHDTLQSVGLLWTSDQLVAETST
jgi:hypothetical protein